MIYLLTHWGSIVDLSENNAFWRNFWCNIKCFVCYIAILKSSKYNAAFGWPTNIQTRLYIATIFLVVVPNYQCKPANISKESYKQKYRDLGLSICLSNLPPAHTHLPLSHYIYIYIYHHTSVIRLCPHFMLNQHFSDIVIVLLLSHYHLHQNCVCILCLMLNKNMT